MRLTLKIFTRSYSNITTSCMGAGLITAVLLILTVSFTLPSSAFSMDSNGPDIAPEDSSWVYAYAGYGYYQWKMMSQNEYMSLFGIKDSYGIDFKHEATPFTIKKYGVKANIFLVSLGLDYFSNRFSFNTDFDNTRKLQEQNDKRSEQLKFLSGLKFGNLSFFATALFRDFNSTLVSRGYRDIMGGMHPVYYYSEDGVQVPLPVNTEINWYTVFSEYDIKLEYNTGWSLFGFGFRYKTFDSPSVADIRYAEGYNHYNGSVLMYTQNEFMEIFFSSKYLYPIWGDFYWQYHVPVAFTFRYEGENSYFHKTTYPFSVGSAGNLSITYLLKHMKIEAGFDYAMYYSMLMLNSVRLKKDVQFTDSMGGSDPVAPAGSSVDLDLNRLEFFWGFYLQASVFI